MKKIIMILLLLGLSIPAMAGGFKNINSKDAKALLAKNKSIYLLDVRSPEEYRQGYIQGGVLIPINEIERRVNEVPRNRPIVVYCAVGSRSVPVAGFLASKGYREVYNMQDGIMGWYRNGFPVVR
jgi:rhodanese-related sulfurtransferase